MGLTYTNRTPLGAWAASSSARIGAYLREMGQSTLRSTSTVARSPSNAESRLCVPSANSTGRSGTSRPTPNSRACRPESGAARVRSSPAKAGGRTNARAITTPASRPVIGCCFTLGSPESRVQTTRPGEQVQTRA